MNSLTSKLIAALLLAASLAGCAGIGANESATDWQVFPLSPQSGA